jgi:flagellar hook-associated protein 2
MSGITSGVGLVSGLPTADLIDQLMSLQARPLQLLQTRVQDVQLQRTAYAGLSARLLGLKSTVARFDDLAFFRAATVNSSNDNILTATAGDNAVEGTFQFQVKSLVSNNQLLSRGFSNSDSQPVGSGTLSFELGNGRLTRVTQLSSLNGGEGVRRGSIEITDSNGDKSTVDLTTVISVQEVLDEINSLSDVSVQASVENDRLVIEDTAGGTGVASIRDVGGGRIAEDLGIAKQADGAGVIDGDRVFYLNDESLLTTLNDGNGVSVSNTNRDLRITVGDSVFETGLRGLLTRDTSLSVLNNGGGVRQGVIRITNRVGESADITVDGSVQTVGDLMDVIEAADIDVSVVVGAASGQLNLKDDSSPADGVDPVNFVVENVSGSAAVDLGIVADTDDENITGSEIHRITTLGDVIRAINDAVDRSDPNNVVRNSDVVARISENGRGILLSSVSGAEFEIESAQEDGTAADELGLVGVSSGGQLDGRDVLAGLNTVLLGSLRGGSGIGLGEVKVQAADGNEVLIDFSQNPPSSVLEWIGRFNESASGIGVTAQLNKAGNGIAFEDDSGGNGTTRLKDVGSSGTTIADLFDAETGVASTTTGKLNTGNAQLQYLSNGTLLSSLNFGGGIGTGVMRIVASDGAAVDINVTDNQKTVGQVIEVINALADTIGVQARINDNGDGIELIDTSGGGGTLSVTDKDGGRVAKRLNLIGEGKTFDNNGEPEQRINGSFEFQVDVDADDSLEDVRTKINELGIDVKASIVNDGGATNAFRLVVNSEISGTRGAIALDTGETDLSFETLVKAQDAVVFFGGVGAENPIVLTSSTNSLNGVLENVTINLEGVSDEPVNLSVSRDIESVVGALQTFVGSYNSVLDDIDSLTSFNADTQERGVLFGDNSVSQIQNRLRTVVSARIEGAPAGLDRLVLLGIRTGSGGRLTFDDQKFRDLYEQDPEGVETLFTTDDTGLGDRLDQMLDELTRGTDGLIARRDTLLENREELFNDRIEATEEQLARKRLRLQRQFQGLENSLANLQGSQSALGSLASLAGAAG